MNYKIVADEVKLDSFIDFLPENNKDETYYVCLFGRHKYCPEFPNTRDAGQLARIPADRNKLKNKLRRLECPIGSYVRDGVIAPQAALACYITLNPRSYKQANKDLMLELTRRLVAGDFDFNPISLATTCLHTAKGRKFFVDFDFDNAEVDDYRQTIGRILPEGSYKILKTRGGFHVIVEIEKAKINRKFYPELAALPNCDVRGTDNLTPIPGCVQGDFVPCFV